MTSTSHHEEDLQKAINISIQNLSFDDQIKYVEKISKEEEMNRRKYVVDMTYEEQLKLAQELSMKESGQPQSFFKRHFQELHKEQNLNGRDQPFGNLSGPDLDKLNSFANKESDRSSSESDSGFASEDRDLEIALLKSKDPSEQNNEEIRNILVAIERSKSTQEKLWLYRDPVEIQSQNDGYLLTQLQQSLQTPPTPEKLQNIQHFLNDNETLDFAVDRSNVIPGVKSLDELDAEFDQVKIRKRAKKAAKSSSPSPKLAVNGPSVARLTSSPRPELGAIPKTHHNKAVTNHSPARQKNHTKASQFISPDAFQGPERNPSFGKSGPVVHKGFRPIIVDGNNVAYQHGKNDRFSAKGMQIVYEYFVDKFDYSNNDIVIVHKPGGQKTLADLDIIENLYKIDVLIKTVKIIHLHYFALSNDIFEEGIGTTFAPDRSITNACF